MGRPVAGSAALPAGGFSGLASPLVLSRAMGPAGMLPVAHTCFSHLELPVCASLADLNTRLTTALREGGEGFGLA